MRAHRLRAFGLGLCLGLQGACWLPGPGAAGSAERPPSSTAPANRPQESPAQPRAVEEKEAFELAKDIGTDAAWNAFLKRFPDGFFADLARAAQSKARAPNLAREQPRREAPAREQVALPVPAGESLWNHNGSLMRLEADGAARRFYYERPRAGIAQQGATRGTLLFDGRKSGDRYEGTAWIFSQRCGRFPYAVSGHVENGQTRVIMHGKAPKPGGNCGIASYRDDMLVFDYQGR